MAEPIHSCMTKAVIGDGDHLECGPKWVTARRARLKLFNDHLECGDWLVRYDEIHAAELSKFNSPILRIPGYILAVKTKTKTYHFGLNGWRYWQGELPFAVERKQTRLRLSPYSIVARVVIFCALIYFVWDSFN